jgi:hypothetical protein
MIFVPVKVGRWIDNIKTAPLEIGVNVVDWIGLAQVMNLRVP